MPGRIRGLSDECADEQSKDCHLYLISPEVIGGSLQAGRWIKFRRALGRIRLLMGSPIASLLGPSHTKGKGREESYQWKAPRQ